MHETGLCEAAPAVADDELTVEEVELEDGRVRRGPGPAAAAGS